MAKEKPRGSEGPTDEASYDDAIELDPQAAERKKALREYRLNVVEIPVNRVIGFSILCLVLAIHNRFILDNLSWRVVLTYAAIAFGYSLGSWALLAALYRRIRSVDLGDVFLFVDIVIWAVAIYFSGGTESWLIFLMMIRAAEHGSTNFRRALAYAHFSTACYAAVIAFVAFVDRTPLDVPEQVAKLFLVYFANIYVSFAARTVEKLRNRTTAAIHMARELIVQLRENQHQLEEARSRAEEGNRAKSAFLSNMSHELRTPLNAILGFVQVMERKPDRDAEDRENLAIITRAGEHLLGLINDVLSIAKIEAGKLTLAEHPFDLRLLLEGLEEIFSPRTQAKGLQLMFEVSVELPRFVHGDEGRLRQVLINLLGNAVKFTDQGGVALRMQWQDGVAEFEVEDTGQGIAENELHHLFQAFAQTESGRGATEGTGLGLAISRNFIRLMGGDISVRSELGRGSTFRVAVPLPECEGMEAPPEQPRVVRLAHGQPAFRILAVDDKWENRLLLVRILTSVGFEVREAANGKEAIDVWREWKPHLVWMDIRMPILNGYDATRIIREEERLHARDRALDADDECLATPDGAGPAPRDERPERTVVIALSASAFEHDRVSIRECGCDDFVAKPFRESTIFEKLQEYLGVEFEYDEPEVDDEAAEESADTAEIAGLPSELLAELSRAIESGDVDGAMRTIDHIGEADEPLARELRKMVKAYDFDALQDLLDTVLRAR